MKDLIRQYKVNLEKVLDEGFPKIYEEGPEKIANKRGPALALFAEAVLGAHRIVIALTRCPQCRYCKDHEAEYDKGSEQIHIQNSQEEARTSSRDGEGSRTETP